MRYPLQTVVVIALMAMVCGCDDAEADDVRRRTVDEQPRPVVEVFEQVDKGHGRLETRTLSLCRDLAWLTTSERWRGLSFVAKIVRQRTVLTTDLDRDILLHRQRRSGHRRHGRPGDSPALGYRKPAPLGFGPRVPRGRCPPPGQEHRREHDHPAQCQSVKLLSL